MRVAFDTNILVYAEGMHGQAAKERARRLVADLPAESGMVPLQVLGELYNVLVRKAGWTAENARRAALSWRNTLQPIGTSPQVMEAALELAAMHQQQIWDSVILAAASEGGCSLLLSEDLQDGFTWRGVTIANPFAPRRHGLLDEILGGAE
jgi:predicted nucleic acid-binding protein